MIITNVEVPHLREVPSTPWSFSGAWTGVSPILVRTHTNEGLTGIGASYLI